MYMLLSGGLGLGLCLGHAISLIPSHYHLLSFRFKNNESNMKARKRQWFYEQNNSSLYNYASMSTVQQQGKTSLMWHF